MLRMLLALAVYAALTVSSFAQATPKEAAADSTIRLQPGEVRALVFDQSIDKWDIPADIVQVVPETERTFSFRAIKPGSTVVAAFYEGRLVHRARLIVSGGFVRIYGTQASDVATKDYLGYICTETGCARADPEAEKAPSNTSVATTRRNSRGDIVTTTKQY